MSEPFNPYHQWLGIPAAEQPPHHYRLLGLTLYEPSRDVIDQAVDRQMTFVQMYKTGPHSAASQHLLNELTNVRRVLLDPQKKAAYDAELHRRLGSVSSFSSVVSPPNYAVKFPPHPFPAATPGAWRQSTSSAGETVATGPAIAESPRPGYANGVNGSDREDGPEPSSGSSPSRSLAAVAQFGSASLRPLVVGAATAGVVVLIGLVFLLSRPRPAAPPVLAPVAVPLAEVVPVAARAEPRPTATPMKLEGDAAAVASVQGQVPARSPVSLPVAAPSSTPPRTRSTPPIAANAIPFDPLLDDAAIPSEEPTRDPVPQGEARAAAEALVDDVFGRQLAGAKTPSQQAALASELLAHAQKREDDAPTRFVVLDRARRLAESAKDAPLAMATLDEIGRTFQLDVEPLKVELLTPLDRAARTPREAAWFAEAWLSLARKTLAAEKFETAARFAEQAESTARRANDVGLVGRAGTLVTEIAAREAAFLAGEAAQRALAENPRDAAAAEAAGRFLCFFRGDFAHGLLLLAQSEGELSSLANDERSSSGRPEAAIALGEGWWSVAERETDATVKKAAMRRAVGWHRRALVGAAGLSRKKIESRIAEWEALNPPLPHGEWVDLLPFIDLKKSPSWSWKGQAVGVFIDTQWPKLNVPVIPEGSYDLRVKVVLTNGGDQILFRMPVGEGVVVASLVGREGLHRLMADGEALLGSTFATNVNLPSGQEVVFDASVVVSGERAVVTGSVDGKLVMRWEGAISSLPRNALSEHDRMCLRLDGGTNRLWFNAVQIRIRDGRVRLGTE